MQTTEYHRILELPVDADPPAIRAAFRRAVKQVHPDVRPGNGADSRELDSILRAYQALMREAPPVLRAPVPHRPTSDPVEAAARTFLAPMPRWEGDLERQLDALPLSELAHCLSTWLDRHGRCAAARALARRRQAGAMRLLLVALDQEVDRSVKVEMIRALGRSGDRRAIFRLAGLLDDPDPRIARAARLAVERLDAFHARHATFSPHSPHWLRRLVAWLRL
ncbi:DnaJ domain-containing protein [bacterium]|nr:DnaJ domain-containing protein [bacterium]